MCQGFAALFIIMVASGVLGDLKSDRPSWQKPGCHRIGHSRKVDVPGCATFTATTNACRGFCESWAFPSGGRASQPVTSLAQCCSIMDSEDVTVRVPCMGGERDITLKSATSCSCYHCRKD